MQTVTRLIGRSAHFFDVFGVTISLKNIEVIWQGIDSPLSIHIGNHELNTVDRFQYLGFTISSNLSREPEISSRKASKESVAQPDNEHQDAGAYKTCVQNTLLYSNETWTYASQEKKVNTFHFRWLRRILDIGGQDKIPNTGVLKNTGLPSIIRCTADGRIPKGLL